MASWGRAASTAAGNASVWPVAALMLNALVWGLSWWPFRQLQAQGLHPLWSTALIYLLCLACLMALRPRSLHYFAHITEIVISNPAP